MRHIWGCDRLCYFIQLLIFVIKWIKNVKMNFSYFSRIWKIYLYSDRLSFYSIICFYCQVTWTEKQNWKMNLSCPLCVREIYITCASVIIYYFIIYFCLFLLLSVSIINRKNELYSLWQTWIYHIFLYVTYLRGCDRLCYFNYLFLLLRDINREVTKMNIFFPFYIREIYN